MMGLVGRELAELVIRAADGAFVSAADGRIVLWNGSAERMLGWSAKETLGRSWETLFAGDEGEPLRSPRPARRAANRARLDESVRRYERKIRAKSGDCLWLDITTFQAPGSNGSGPLAIHLLRDLTATKALLEIAARAVSPMPSRNGLGLSRREDEVLALMSGGGSTRAMAERLQVSRATIRNHIQNIFTKLDVHSRLEAVAWANRQRLV